ncbi:helix-turn-helix transcriptional regulator [Propioniciclava soli]|uniref:helix-turn-helix transcriptional regulator n=1 Tax=Propioniciclava soli TaxID=2775081 RepID=UPI001E31D1B5|nr:helix-turn-helix domain-containing protein [Propioniciclava soli]
MGSVTRPLHPALRPYVASCVGYDYRLPTDAVHHGVPSPALTAIIAFDAPLDCGWVGETASGRFWTLAAGLHTRPSLIRTHGSQVGLQLGLTPRGSRALLGVPAAPLASALVPGDELGAALPRCLHERLAPLGWAQRFTVLEEHLLGRLGRAGRAAHPVAEQGWRRLTGAPRRVEEVAGELGISRRHLRNLFVAEFGLSPKEVAQVARFDRARTLAARGVPLAQTAAAAGYADQPHLTREWRRFAGLTPTATLAEFPIVQDPLVE